MLLSAVSTNLLTAIPNALGGAVGIAIVSGDGSIEASSGSIDGLMVRICDGRPTAVSKTPAHRVVTRELATGRGLLVAMVPADTGSETMALVQGGLDLVQDRDLVEGDFESINASSLALLEEVALLGETLPRLPTGNSDHEVAEIGLEALVRAASCERAIYVEYHRGAEVCSVLAQMGIDSAGRKAVSIPYEGSPQILPGDNLVWRAIQSDRSVLLETVTDGERLGAPGSPEYQAEQQVIAVPVRYGNDEKRATLGVVLVIDKRARAYSSEAGDREFGSQETKLATGVASMMGSVLGMRSVVALDKEMRLAKEIQQQILPDRAADIDRLELAGRCINSGAVGGDYFDYLPMADGRWLTVVADVSGHNLASGMIMVSVRATLRTLAARGTDVAAVFDELASSLYQDLTRSERFLTAVGVALSAEDRRIQIVNAGHNDTMIYRRASGEVERLPSTDPILGFLPSVQHEIVESSMNPGDVALIYTDGFTEATNSDGEMLGEERLAAILIRVARESSSSDAMLNGVYSAVDQFCDRPATDDDITAVVIRALEEDE